MRALLTLWWWRWVTSAHDRLHAAREHPGWDDGLPFDDFSMWASTETYEG